MLLPVSAPFHCALMAPAQERLRDDLDATEFRDLAMSAGQQLAGARNSDGRRGARGLFSRCRIPVRWVETVRYLAAQGVTRCIEVGAGGVLTGLLRSIDPALAGAKFGEPADLESCEAGAGRDRDVGGGGAGAGFDLRAVPCGNRGELREDGDGAVVLAYGDRGVAEISRIITRRRTATSP